MDCIFYHQICQKIPFLVFADLKKSHIDKKWEFAV